MKVCTVEGCDRRFYSRDMCNMHYLRWLKHGDPNVRKKRETAKLSFSIDENGCFVCKDNLNNDGYPQATHRKRTVRAYKMVYEEMFGEIEKGLSVRHKCDNRMCVNPEHLELGTFLDNMRDKIKRKRYPIGEANGTSILTEQKVKEILIMLKDGVKQSEIAEKYKVSTGTIYGIKTKRVWKHVELEERGRKTDD